MVEWTDPKLTDRKPGERCPRSGQWQQRGPNATGPERTVVAGEPFPPAPEGWTYTLVDASDHVEAEVADDDPDPAG